MSIQPCKFGDPLTETQKYVFALIGAALLNKQIAYELGMSEATVKSHVGAILIKLGVPSRVHVALHYHNIGKAQIERAIHEGTQQ